MDNSEMAQRALEYAVDNHPDAEITVLHAVGEPSPMGGAATSLALEDDLEAAAEERAEGVFDRARALAAEHEVEITTEVRLGHPTRAILNRADDDRVSNNLEQSITARPFAELDPGDGSETQPCPPLAASDVSDLTEYHTLRE